eukprot:2116029-Rhodomonas_salina.1
MPRIRLRALVVTVLCISLTVFASAEHGSADQNWTELFSGQLPTQESDAQWSGVQSLLCRAQDAIRSRTGAAEEEWRDALGTFTIRARVRFTVNRNISPHDPNAGTREMEEIQEITWRQPALFSLCSSSSSSATCEQDDHSFELLNLQVLLAICRCASYALHGTDVACGPTRASTLRAASRYQLRYLPRAGYASLQSVRALRSL